MPAVEAVLPAVLPAVEAVLAVGRALWPKTVGKMNKTDFIFIL